MNAYAAALPPLGSGRRKQTVPSDQILDLCHYCHGPIYFFEPRMAGGVPAHYWCNAMHFGEIKTEPVHVAKEPEEHRRYRLESRSLRLATLCAIVVEYENAGLLAAHGEPVARTPDMVWKIAIIRDEIDRRSDG